MKWNQVFVREKRIARTNTRLIWKPKMFNQSTFTFMYIISVEIRWLITIKSNQKNKVSYDPLKSIMFNEPWEISWLSVDLGVPCRWLAEREIRSPDCSAVLSTPFKLRAMTGRTAVWGKLSDFSESHVVAYFRRRWQLRTAGWRTGAPSGGCVESTSGQ